MSHLRALLTERADDSHAAPVAMSLRKARFRGRSSLCQPLVRFFGSFRIEPHVPLVVCLPANSFEFQPCGRTPQVACLTGYLRYTPRQKSKNAASKHTFRARTTQVSNLLRSPSFRVSVSVSFQKLAFATGVPQGINAFHYSSLSSNLPKENSILLVFCPCLRLGRRI